MTGDPAICIIAHRGASRAAPENTLSAIRAALIEGADGIELDVRLTRDDEPILMHDPDLLRTTGDPRPVAHCMFSDLAALDAGSWFGRDYIGERIPHLDEALSAAAGFRVINLDLKHDPGFSTALGERVLASVQASPVAPRCHLTVSDSLLLSFCLEHAPDVPTGRLVESPGTAWPTEGLAFLSVRHDLITDELVHRAAGHGLAIWAWTVNDPDRAIELAGLGVKALITDVPAELNRALRSGG